MTARGAAAATVRLAGGVAQGAANDTSITGAFVSGRAVLDEALLPIAEAQELRVLGAVTVIVRERHAGSRRETP